MYIKGGDLFVVQDFVDGEVKSYSGLQLTEDMRQLMGESVQIWMQGSPPPTVGSPDFVTTYDLWFDTSVAAFFVASRNVDGELTWIVVNPADHKDILKNTSQDEYFPPSGAVEGEVWTHPGSGVNYYYRAMNNQWCDATGAGEREFVLRAGDTMTGNLQLPQLIVTGDDTVEALIEINEGIITADDSVAGEEQRLYFNGDTIAKHEDVVTITNRLINNDQHIENITPYTFRGLQQFGTTEAVGGYVLYDSNDTATDTISLTEKVFVSDTDLTSQTLDDSLVTHGMYLEVQAIEGSNKLVGKVIKKTDATDGTIFTLEDIKSNGVSVDGEVSHVRIFSVADSSAKGGVFYQPNAPMAPNEHLNVGQLWVDSSTNIQYIWTGEEWSEVGAACGSGGSSMSIPIGTIWPYAGSITAATPLPRGWLLCDGSNIDGRYVRLKELLGVDKVPDLRGKYLGGAGRLGLDGVRSEKTDFTRRPRMTEAYNKNNNALISGSVSNTNLGNHKHGIGTIEAKTNNDGKHTHKFKSEGFNATGGKNALRPENNSLSFNTDENQGAHNHTITMSGDTANKDLGNHTHSFNIAYYDWDEYTRPYTYAVHWIIKHD